MKTKTEAAVLAELKKYGKRWDWDGVDCTWTGKDADLETHGYQGCKLIRIDKGVATVEVHAGKTVAGTDVCLNTPRRASRRAQDSALEYYLKKVTAVICDCSYHGYWSGDDWFITHEVTIEVPVVTAKYGKVDAETTASAIVMAAEESLKDWDRECEAMEEILSVISGWSSYRPSRKKHFRRKEGHPGPGSAWAQSQAR